MRLSLRSMVLMFLALVTAGLAALKALGYTSLRKPTPRELAAEFLRKAVGDGESVDAVVGDKAGGATQGEGAFRPLFTDVAPSMGIAFTHDNALRGNYLLPEEMGPGGGFLDYDNDGDLDIFVAAGGAIIDDGPVQTCRLYRNDGDRFADVTEEANAGVAGPAYGVACADYDNDGDVDIYLTRVGPNAMLRNDGDGRFEEVAESAGVADPGFGVSTCFFDYDRDGQLDLYVVNYVEWSFERESTCFAILGERDYCSPLAYKPAVDRLYRNRGNGDFEDVSESAGIAPKTGNGLAVLASDFDGDGWIDVYVANDQTPAFLWHNLGDGRFEDTALLSGCAYDGRGVAIAGMGLAYEDLDADGDQDLMITNIRSQTHLVFFNDAGLFEDVSARMGVAKWSMPATTFGIALFDQDNDGRMDGFFANGEVNLDNLLQAGDNPFAQPDHFVRLIDGGLVDMSAQSGASFADVGRGVSCGDYDNDGDLDLLVTNNGGPLRLLRNENDTGGAWFMVSARTGPGRRAAIGARVVVTAGEASHCREVRPQQSYLSSGDPRVHFGLGEAEIVDRLEILWPDGSRTEREGLDVNQLVVIDQEGGGVEPTS